MMVLGSGPPVCEDAMKEIKMLVWCVLAAVLAAGAAPAAKADEPAAPATPAAHYAYFEVDGYLRESLPAVYLFETEAETLHDLLGRIERARNDGNVQGLIVKVGSLDAGWAKVQDIRAALSRCRAEGKDVICYLEGADSRTYYLATGAGRIVSAPTGHLMLVGLRAEAIFAKGLLDKIGAEADFVQAGEYKTAGETLMRQEPSPAFRESMESVLRDYYHQLLAGIAEGRGIAVSAADELVRGGPYTAQQAMEVGALDGVMFYDELLADLRERHGGPVVVESDYGKEARPQPLKSGPFGVFSLLMGGGAPRRPEAGGPAIAVLHASGPIMTGEFDGFGLGEEVVAADSFVKVIRKAAADENIKAIVLRVESPGGSALACDIIWRELRLADRKKPVIASLSDVAASGGYYIAAGARKVVAEPGALTGSIGVVAGKLVLGGLFEKLGLNVAVFEEGGNAGMMSMFSKFSDEERGKLEQLVLRTYDIFLSRVAETRPGMAVADVDKVAQGRIWTGRQAAERGLVDTLGGIGEAVAAAKEAAGIPPDQVVQIVHLPRSRSLVEVVLFGKEGEAEMLSPWNAAAMLAAPPSVRAYLLALLPLQREIVTCTMPAAVTIR